MQVGAGCRCGPWGWVQMRSLLCRLLPPQAPARAGGLETSRGMRWLQLCTPVVMPKGSLPPLLPAEEHLLTVQQRLGMVLALLGRLEEGRALLHEVQPALGEPAGLTCGSRLALPAALLPERGRMSAAASRCTAQLKPDAHLLLPLPPPAAANLGEGNPASEELGFMLSLVSAGCASLLHRVFKLLRWTCATVAGCTPAASRGRVCVACLLQIGLREMEADGVSDAARRQELLAAMKVRCGAAAAVHLLAGTGCAAGCRPLPSEMLQMLSPRISCLLLSRLNCRRQAWRTWLGMGRTTCWSRRPKKYTRRPQQRGQRQAAAAAAARRARRERPRSHSAPMQRHDDSRYHISSLI